MLTTLDIRRLLRGNTLVGGVFPVDRLPLITRRPVSVIINLDPSYKEGSHWVAVNFDKNGYAFYFDSFGRKPEGHILTFIERFAPRGYDYSKEKLQDNYSTSCGYFAILFVLLSNDRNRFFSLFQKCKTEKNEQKLLKIIKNFID